MECLKCHTPLPDNSRFCFACGADQTGGGTATATSGELEGLQARLQRIVEGKYQLKRMLGKGGMGAVFLAQDLTLDREVAIKVLPPDISQDPKVIQRFQQEAKTAAKLDHTNIIPIYRVESEGGLNYFVMKYIVGTSLEDVLEQKQPLSTGYIQRVLWEAACALGHAHQRGIVHRDVKPANILFDHDGRVMLTDFGISKALQSASGFTGTGMIIGTPHYMAPEQAKGQPVDGRADQYSMGVVGYRMITGQLPFSGDSVHTILYKHIFEEAPRASGARPDLPPHLSEAIARALSKEPDQRFPTMEDFATAVWPEQPVSAPKGGKAAVTSRPRPRPVTAESPTEAVSAAPTTPIPKAARPSAGKPEPKKSKAGLSVGVAAVVMLGVGGYLVLGRGKAATDQQQQAAPPRTSPQPAPPVVITDTVRDTVRVPVQAPQPTRPQRQTPVQRPPAQQQTPAPPVEEWGYITIDATPVSGTVYVDGVEAGFTPLASYRVKPGLRTIRIQSEGYKTITDRLQVDAGNTVRKRYPLIPEG
ncbi:MAG: protein kinase [Gemmatimonadetes bacterium]|nr:protein kinase [Gemmatimonadota bacterium]